MKPIHHYTMHTHTGKSVALATLLAGILFLLGSGATAFAQDHQDWKFTHPKPQPNTLRKLRSTDMGDSWSAIDVPVNTDLQAVSFVDSQLGYACGTNSQVVKTTDAGLTWAPVTRPSTTNYVLQAMEFVDANTGWVFVNSATVPGGNIF